MKYPKKISKEYLHIPANWIPVLDSLFDEIEMYPFLSDKESAELLFVLASYYLNRQNILNKNAYPILGKTRNTLWANTPRTINRKLTFKQKG